MGEGFDVGLSLFSFRFLRKIKKMGSDSEDNSVQVDENEENENENDNENENENENEKQDDKEEDKDGEKGEGEDDLSWSSSEEAQEEIVISSVTAEVCYLFLCVNLLSFKMLIL
jgi:hypothetical protein